MANKPMTVDDEPLIDWIPEPETIRDHLRSVIRRIDLLRALLKVSERKEKLDKKAKGQ